MPEGPASSEEFPVLRDVLTMYYSEAVGDGRMFADDIETFTIVSVTYADEDLTSLCEELRTISARSDDEVERFFRENQRSGLEAAPRTWILSIQGQLCG